MVEKRQLGERKGVRLVKENKFNGSSIGICIAIQTEKYVQKKHRNAKQKIVLSVSLELVVI